MEIKKRSGRYSSTHNGENLMNPIITFPDKIVTCVHLCENGRGGVFLWSWKVGLTSSFNASMVAVTLSLVQWPPLPPHPIPTMSLLQLPMWHSLCIYHCSWITGSQQHSINCAAGCALCIFWPTYCQMHSEEAGKKLHTWVGPTHSGCSDWPKLKAKWYWYRRKKRNSFKINQTDQIENTAGEWTRKLEKTWVGPTVHSASIHPF